MGIRVRLKANFEISGYSPDVQVILTVLKKHGMFLAEHGTDWYVSGTHDPRWNDEELRQLQKLRGRDFEVVRLGEVQTK